MAELLSSVANFLDNMENRLGAFLIWGVPIGVLIALIAFVVGSILLGWPDMWGLLTLFCLHGFVVGFWILVVAVTASDHDALLQHGWKAQVLLLSIAIMGLTLAAGSFFLLVIGVIPSLS